MRCEAHQNYSGPPHFFLRALRSQKTRSDWMLLGLMIVQKLFGIQQSPQEVLVAVALGTL
jgi:hypothetical protein